MRDDRLFWIVMGILGVGLVVLVFNDSAGQTAGVDNYDFARLVQLSVLALVFGTAVLARRQSAGSTLRQIAIWLVIFLAIMVGYQFADQYGWIPGSAPRPGIPDNSGTGISASLMNGVDSRLHL